MGSLRRMIERGVACNARRPWITFSTRSSSAILHCYDEQSYFAVVCLLLITSGIFEAVI